MPEDGNQTAIKVYTIQFYSNYIVKLNPMGGNVSPTSIEAEAGKEIGTLPNPIRGGYAFKGWYTAEAGGEKVTIATKIAGNMTVYARWEKISDVATYTVTLNPTGGNVSPTSIQVIMGKEIGTLPTPTRNGYSFKGWYTAANGGTAVNMTMKVTSNMTIYAHWESLAAESRFKKGKLWYKVVKPALSTSKEGTVSVVGPVNKNLRKATIPLTVKSGSFTYKVVSVAKFAFKNNKKLKNVKIGNNVQQISNGAFYGCTSLVKVTIGKNTEKIGSKVFYKARKLKNVIIQSKKLKSVGGNAFKNIHKSAKIKVPPSRLNKYKNKVLKGKGQKKTVKVIKN